MSISTTLFDDQRARQASQRKEVSAEVKTRIAAELSQLDLPPKLEVNLEKRAAELIDVALSTSGTRDMEARKLGVVDTRLLDLIASKDPSERMSLAKAMIDPREADSNKNFVHGSVRISFIERETEALARIEEGILKIQDGHCPSPRDSKNLERLFTQKAGKERSIAHNESAVRSAQSSLYRHLKSSHVEGSYQETLVSLPTGRGQTILSAMKEYGPDYEKVAAATENFIDAQHSRLSALDKQHRNEYHDELAALTISVSLANPEVSGAYRQRVIESARTLQADGNESSILADATAKYDPAKKIVAETSTYIMSPEEHKYHEKNVAKGNFLGVADISSYLVAEFNRSPLSETRQISRAGQGRSDGQERARGGFIILAKKLKSEGNEAALQELMSLGASDPKLSMVLKASDLKNLTDIVRDETFVSQSQSPLQIFEKSFASFQARNSGMDKAELDALAIRNLQSKNYSSEYLEKVAKNALEAGNIELAEIVRASIKQENQVA